MHTLYAKGQSFRWMRLLSLLLLLLPLAGRGQQAFAPGNLVVVRVGDGTTVTASGAAAATFLLEYTPAGALVQTIALPTAASGSNAALTNTASSSSDALMTRSVNGSYLVLTGYNATVGTAGIAGAASTTVNRVIGRIAADGTFDTSTRIADAFSANNIRSAATVNGSTFYAVGGNSGVVYLPFGNAAAPTTALNSTAPTNNRGVNIFGGNLYVSSASGTNQGISQVGTGLPTTSGQTITLLPGFPTASGPQPYGFYFADLSPSVAGVDVVYVADDRTVAPGGIQKWSLVGGTWTYNGSMSASPAVAIRGLDGSTTGTTVSLAASGNGGVYLVTDNAGYNMAPSTTTITAIVPAPGANAVFRGVAFAPVAAPTIASFSPTSGNAGTTVTITGTNFTGATAVTLNGAAITGFTVVNGTTITFTVPAGATSGTLAVTTPGGTATSTGTFTVLTNNPVPTITSLSPASATAGDPAQTLTVTGMNFIASSSVSFNGTARTTTYVSATQLTIQLTAADLATAGSYDVTVTNPAPGGGTTAATAFVVNSAPANNPVPTISSLSPSSVIAGAAAQTLTVTGMNFIASSSVSFNGTARTTTYVSATQLTIQLTAADQSTAGSYNVTVTNPTPGGGTTAASTFTVNPVPSNPVPTITSLSPSSVIAGAAAQTLTVTGTNFIAASVVNFNGTARTTTYVSATQLTIQLTAADQATVGSYNVTVTNPAPGGGTTAASTFTVNPVPAPTLTAISPSNPVGGATYVVTLTGTNFGTVANTTVNFNGTAVVPTSITGGGTSLVVSLALPAAGGTFPVTVTAPSGTSGPQSLTVAAAPAGFFEPFEPGTQGGYPTAATPVALRTGSYSFVQALLGNITPPGDKFNNAQSARIRGGGSITMGFDKAGGAGVVTISAALYGSDTGANLTLEYSTDGGTTFVAAPGSPATLTATLTPYTFTLNQPGSVRVRIGTTNTTVGANPRINVDDLQIADFAAVCDAPTALTPGSITSSSATVGFTASASAALGYTVNTSPVTTTQTLPAGATSVSLTGLLPNTSYTVSIVSNCSATSNSAAATATFSTLALAPTLAVSQGGTGLPSGGTAYNFGNQTVSTTSGSVAFTLTNGGPDPLTIGGITTTGDYALSGAAPTTVAANGGTATVSVTFTPTATGTRNGTLVINSNATNGATYTVNLTGTGQPAALPDLLVNTGTLASPTPIAGNYNNVTITGTGAAVLFGPLTAAGTLTVQSGGILAQNCQLLSGTGSFTLQAGATLIICDAAGISPTGVPTGAVLVAGTRSYSPGANYIYNGTVAQVTGLGLPATVLAIGVQNAAGLSLSQGVSLTQGLQLQTGSLNTNGQPFTLLSTATGTAGVVNAGSGVVVGAATVQRFITSSNALGYRHYSAPVSNTTFADLNATGFSPVFNTGGYNGSATPGQVTPFPTVFGYDQSRIATVTSNFSAFNKGWFAPNGPADPMVVGKGYTVNAPNTALIDFVGTLNNGAVPSGTLSRGSDPAAGWQLLGNPYPSPLDWNTVTPAQRPGMDAAIYVFESAGQYGGSYRASVNGVGGNANSPQPIVVSGQGYFVRVTTPNGTGQVNLDNTNRVTTFGPQPSFGRGAADLRPQVALELRGASLTDAAYVYFEAGATTGKDVEFDATKLANPTGLNLASLAGAEALAINGLPALGTATVLVPLSVAAPQAGSYSLTAGTLANLAGTTVTLVDALTGTRTVLAAGTTYAFTLAGTTAPGRFALEFRPTGALAATAAQALAAQTQLFPNPASASFRVQLPVLSAKMAVQATLLNALGQTVLRRSLSAPAGQALDAEFDVRALAAGVYTLRLDVAGTLVTRKVVVE